MGDTGRLPARLLNARDIAGVDTMPYLPQYRYVAGGCVFCRQATRYGRCRHRLTAFPRAYRGLLFARLRSHVAVYALPGLYHRATDRTYRHMPRILLQRGSTC